MQDFRREDMYYLRAASDAPAAAKSLHPAYHFRLTARDLARFGYLLFATRQLERNSNCAKRVGCGEHPILFQPRGRRRLWILVVGEWLRLAREQLQRSWRAR